MQRSEIKGRIAPQSGVGIIGPWLVIERRDNPIIRIDLRLLDALRAYESSGLLLECGDSQVTLGVEDGREAIARMLREAAPFVGAIDTIGEPLPPSMPCPPRLVIVSSTSDASASTDDTLAGTTYELSHATHTIGRATANDLAIAHRGVSTHHARITCEAGRYTIENLSSTNATRINGAERATHTLIDGDTIDLGQIRMRFDLDDDLELPLTSPPDARQFVMVGSDPIAIDGSFVHIGAVSFRLAEASEYALAGANLPLPGGGLIQAAFVMLTVAARSR